MSSSRLSIALSALAGALFTLAFVLAAPAAAPSSLAWLSQSAAPYSVVGQISEPGDRVHLVTHHIDRTALDADARARLLAMGRQVEPEEGYREMWATVGGDGRAAKQRTEIRDADGTLLYTEVSTDGATITVTDVRANKLIATQPVPDHGGLLAAPSPGERARPPVLDIYRAMGYVERGMEAVNGRQVTVLTSEGAPRPGDERGSPSVAKVRTDVRIDPELDAVLGYSRIAVDADGVETILERTNWLRQELIKAAK